MPEVIAQTPLPTLYDNRDYQRSTQLPGEDGSIWGAAFRQENDVVNAAMFLGRPNLEVDKDFDLEAAIKKSDIALNAPDLFLSATSQNEFDRIEQRLMQEMQDRRTMEAGGWSGLFAGMAAGTLSPTVLLPGGAGVKAGGFLAGARSSAKWALLGTTAQETVLQANQEFRTSLESGLSVATSGLFSALIGGGLGYMGKRTLADYDADPSKLAEPRDAQGYNAARGIGAEYAGVKLNDAGGVEGGVIIEAQGNLVSPVVRTISQKTSSTARQVMSNLSSAGLKFADNIQGVTQARFGDIESLVKQYEYFYVKATLEARQGYKKWLRSQNRRAGFLPGNMKDFNIKVGEALFSGDENLEPGVAEGVKGFREMFETVLKEAKEAKLQGFDEIENSDTYVTRIIKSNLVRSQYADFVQVMKEHSIEVFREELAKRSERAASRVRARQQEIADAQLSAEDADKLRAQLEKEIFNLPATIGGEAGDVAEDIRALRAEARNRALPKDERDALRAQARQMEKDNKELLKPFRAAERGIRKRFSNLDKNLAALKRAERDLLARAETLEKDQLATMNRAIRSGQKLLAKLGKLSDENLDDELQKLETQFDRAFGVYERGEAKLDSLKDDTGLMVSLEESSDIPTDKISRQEQLQAQRVARAEAALNKLRAAQDLDRDAARAAVQDAIDEANARTVRTITRRDKRIERLRERAAAASPEARQKRLDELSEETDTIIQQFHARVSEDLQIEAEDYDALGLPQFNIEEAAENWARAYADRNTAEATTIPNISMIQERGPMIKRTLNIDPNRVWSNGRRYRDFLEQDVEIIGRRYVRTMAGDIELKKRFGEVNPLREGGKLRQQIEKEYETAKAEAAERVKKENPDADQAALDSLTHKAVDGLDKERADVLQDLEAVIGRIRHTWGIPSDPDGIGHRLGRTALNLNTLRFMGGVVIASIPDLAQPIIKHGLLRTFRNGWLPMITHLKQMHMFKHELQAAGAALDVIMHSRAAAMADVFAEIENGTRAERGLQQMTNKMGLIAMFDYWTSFMKQIAGAVGNAEITQSLDLLAKQGGSLKARQQAERFLSSVFIDREMAERIYGQLMLPGGSTRVNGALLPNTEAWVDKEAIRTYRAALARLTEDTIVTPGVERPRWVDATIGGRMLGQFRSFTYSTTTKTLLNGQQNIIYGVKQRDMQQAMQPIIGTMFSVGMGAMAYYLWAQARGGSALEEMRNADAAKWADEAILRSGLLGVLGEVQKVAERTPVTSSFATISGTPTERSPFVDPFTSLLGPSADLAKSFDKVLMSLGTEQENLQDTAKNSRTLLPYQNLFYLKLMERFSDSE